MPVDASPRRKRRSALLHAGGRCELRCALCDCTVAPSTATEIARVLRGGCERLLVRGACDNSGALDEIIGRAREEGVSDIVARTSAVWCQSADAAAGFARRGLDAVLVPLFSTFPAVHDRVAGRDGALRAALLGIRHLAAAGLAIEVEIPILAERLQRSSDVVRLARRAAPSLRALRFYTPVAAPAVLAPPSWQEGGAALAAAVSHAREIGVEARLSPDSNIPLCALREFPDLYDAYSINPKARSSTRGVAVLGEVCRTCAVRAQCPGITPAYLQAHGESGLVAYDQRPKLMYEQRTTRRREWTDEQRAAASQASLMVLRPTVNCNQDCTFCSANETSSNVWADHDQMLRAIARAARRGVSWISFSGGEPTLSRHLVEYIRCATRLGIERREIVSNAVLLDRKEKVAALAGAGLSDAFVSLHAHDETLSRQSTQKVGDFARTVRGIGNLLEAGVRTALNHVITARNFPYLQSYVEMVRREFGGRVKISFAFVTPQFKALDNLEVMPRITDIMPYLKRAMYRALELQQPFAVGSRQGIPFCFLDEFRAWSDGLKLSRSAIAEDSPQKQRAEVCDECRFSDHCTGLWRPYVATYGLDEVQAVAGARLSDAELGELERKARDYPWGEPMSFDEVSPLLREPSLERGPPVIETAAPAPTEPVELVRSRPLRLAILGSGRQARRLARAAVGVAGISIDAVASPHASQAELSDFGSCPVYASAEEALDDIRPEAVIVAAATIVHDELTRLAIAREIPVLLEKPVTSTVEEALALCDLVAASDAIVVPAHNTLHASGLEQVLGRPFEQAQISYTWRRKAGSGDTMRTWNRGFLYESLYHLLAVIGGVAGGGTARVSGVQHRGEGTPASLRIDLCYEAADASLVLDFAAAVEEDVLRVQCGDDEESRVEWRRRDRAVSVADAQGTRAVESRGSDVERMLVNFCDVVLGEAEPATTLAAAVDVMSTARRVIEAVEAAGAPFDRRNAPRHVASRELRQPLA